MDVRYVDFAGAQKSLTRQSRKKCIFRGALRLKRPLFYQMFHAMADKNTGPIYLH